MSGRSSIRELFLGEPGGRPWWKSPLWIVLMAVFIGGWMVLVSKASGAEPEGVVPSESQGRVVAMRCIEEDGSACPKPPDGRKAKRYAKKFRGGDYHNSKQQVFPKSIKKKIRKWYANHPNARATAARAGNDDWWKFEFEGLACTPHFGAGYRVACERAKAHRKVWDQYMLSGAHVSVKCGGAAIIGSLRNGGEVGAGLAAGACLWAEVIDAWF